MKHTKKLLLAMLCIILALTSVLLVVAACNGEETGFKVTVADCEHGTVSVSDPAEGELYDDGESVTVTVTPATDYEVASFKVNGADVELVNGTTYTFNISQDTTIAATFSQIVPETGFSVTVSDYDKAQGSVEVSAPEEGELYDEGETVTVTVTPAADHAVDTFKVNGEDVDLVDGVYTFDVDENTTIAVTFKVVGFSVTVSDFDKAQGSVDVSAPGEGKLYEEGETVTVTVTPAADHAVDTFKVNGEDADLVDGVYTFEIDADATIAVTFKVVGFSVTVSDFDKAQGSVDVSAPGEGKLYEEGEIVTVTVTPAADYAVDSFKVNDVEEALLFGSYKLTVSANTTIAVSFKVVGFGITIEDYDKDKGSVELSAPQDGKLYAKGEKVTVTVKYADDYRVESLKVNGSNVVLVDGKYTFTITGETTIAVTFKDVEQFGVTVSEYDHEQGSVEVSAPKKGGDLYNEDEKVTVTVTPAADHAVKSFKVNGKDAKLVDGEYTFNIAGATTIEVEFEVEHFNVKVNIPYDNRGEVTIDSEKPEGYVKNDVVKLTVTAFEGYELESITVNGDPVEPDSDTENQYSLTITEDVTVEVVFSVTNAKKVLDSLTGSLKVEGIFTNEDFIKKTTTETGMLTIFDSKGYVLMQRYDGTRLTTNMLLKNDNGSPAMVVHDVDGLIASKTESADWAEYFNPFDLLDPADLVLVRDSVWTVDSGTARSIAEAIIGSGSNIDTFEIYVDEQFQANRLVIVFARFSFVGWGIDYQYSYDFELSEHGTAEVSPELYTAYDMSQDLLKLQTALQKAAKATSYTIHYENSEEGYDPYEYNVYYTPDAIYEDYEGWEQGWFTRADGNVWEFQYTKGQFGITDILNVSGLNYYKALFEVKDSGGEYYILFKANGDNTFEVRQEDEVNLGFAGFVGTVFATGRAELETFGYAYTVKITLNEKDELEKVELDLDYYGTVHVVLTFSDWNATTIPADALADINAAKNGVIDAKYVGGWASEDGKYTLDVTLEGLTFNGTAVAADKITATADKVDFVVGADTYSVAAGENGRLVLTGGKLEAGVEFAQCNWADFIGEFVGTFYDGADDEVGKDVTLIITGFEVKLGFDDEEPAAVEILESGYVSYFDGYYEEVWFRFRFTVGEIEYILDQKEEDNYDVFILAKVTGSTGDQLTGWGVYRDRLEELKDWEPYYGEFEGEGYNIVVDEDGITITKGEDVVTIAKDDVFAFTNYDYDSEAYFTQFRFTYNGKDALIQPDEDGLRYVLFVKDLSVQNHEVLQINSVELSLDWSDHISAWEGYEENTNEYFFVEITKDAVYITVGEDGTPFAAKVVFYEEGEHGPQFTLKFAGETLYLLLYTDFGFGVLANEDDSLDVTIDQVMEYQYFYNGVFTSKDGKYKVVISEEGLEVTINGGDPQNVPASAVTFYLAQNGAYTINFQLDGTYYFLQQTGIEYNKLIFTDRNFQVTLFVEGYTVDVSQFVGTFTLDDESGSYSLVVSAEGKVTLTINGKEYEGTDVDVTKWNSTTGVKFYELSFVANGTQYFFQVNGYRAFLYNGEEEGSENYFDVELKKLPAWTAYFGEYESDPTVDVFEGTEHVTLNISANGVEIHVGETVYTIAADKITFVHESNELFEYDLFSFTIDKVNWSIMSIGKSLTIENDAEDDNVWISVTVYKNETGGDDEPITWDDKFIGVYTYDAGEGGIYTFVITADSILFIEPGLDGQARVGKVVEYDEVEWRITVDFFDGKGYLLTLQDKSKGANDSVTQLYVEELPADFDRVSVEDCSWVDYIGLYESNSDEDAEYGSDHVTLIITTEGLIIKVGEVTYNVSADQVTFTHESNVELEYDSFSFTIDEVTWTIMGGFSEGLHVENDAEDDSSVYTTVYKIGAVGESGGEGGDGEPITWDSNWVGVYSGQDKSGVTYELEITADSFLLTIGDEENPFVGRVKGYDELDGYTVVFNGTEYLIADVSYSEGPVAKLFLSTKDYSVNVSLNRVVPSLGIPKEYIGTWTGEAGAGEVELTISDTEITFSCGGTSYDVKVTNVGDSSITFQAGTFTYHITITETGLHLECENFEEFRNADLTKSA